MADDNLNQPTSEQAFLEASEERRQLENEIKSLLVDLEKANPDSLNELADRLKSLHAKRKLIAPN